MRIGRTRIAPPAEAFVLLGRATRLPGKFLLPTGGEPIVRRAARVLSEVGLKVTLVSVTPRPLEGLKVVRDPYDAGPLGGLATARSLTGGPFFLVGGDMPFLSAAAFRRMRREFDGRSLVPVGPGGAWEVLHAVYANLDLDRVLELVRERRGIRDLVDELDRKDKVRFLAPGTIDARSFLDVDTPEQYARLSRPARAGPTGRRSRRPAARAALGAPK